MCTWVLLGDMRLFLTDNEALVVVEAVLNGDRQADGGVLLRLDSAEPPQPLASGDQIGDWRIAKR